MSFLRHYWFATLLGPLLLVWAWRTWRRWHRSPDQQVMVASRRTRGPAPFRRSEFQAKVDAVGREMEKGIWSLTGIFVVGVPALFAIDWLFPSVRDALTVAGFALPVGALALLLAFAVRADLLARQLGLRCPNCGMVLVGGSVYQWPAQHVVFETGACRQCGAQLLDPTEVGPVSIQEESLLRNVVVLLILVGLLAWSIYHVAR
jgi:ribosomal protein S27E